MNPPEIWHPNDLFSPSRAIRHENASQFLAQVQPTRTALKGLERKGASLVVYGTRGIGKTSFAWQLRCAVESHRKGKPFTVLQETLEDYEIERMKTFWITCKSPSMNLASVLLRLLQEGEDNDETLHDVDPAFLREPSRRRELEVAAEVGLRWVKLGAKGRESTEEKSSRADELARVESSDDMINRIFSRTLKHVREKMGGDQILIFIDEADVLDSSKGIGQLIKHTSDARFVVIGVADTPKDIITDHKSAGRKLVNARLNPWSNELVRDFFSRAEKQSQSLGLPLFFSNDFVTSSKELSAGHPEILQDVGYEAADMARDRFLSSQGSDTSTSHLTGETFVEAARRAFSGERGDPTIDMVRDIVDSDPGRAAILAFMASQRFGWVKEEDITANLTETEMLGGYHDNLLALVEDNLIHYQKGKRRVRFASPRDKVIIKFALDAGMSLVD